MERTWCVWITVSNSGTPFVNWSACGRRHLHRKRFGSSVIDQQASDRAKHARSVLSPDQPLATGKSVLIPTCTCSYSARVTSPSRAAKAMPWTTVPRTAVFKPTFERHSYQLRTTKPNIGVRFPHSGFAGFGSFRLVFEHKTSTVLAKEVVPGNGATICKELGCLSPTAWQFDHQKTGLW